MAPNTVLVNKDDLLRYELDVSQYANQQIVWQLAAAEYHTQGKDTALGQLEEIQSEVSAAYDKQLHFAHPVIGR